MSEISELESRIVAALGRIREAVEARASEGEGGDAAARALQAQLDVLEAEGKIEAIQQGRGIFYQRSTVD